MCEYVRKKKAGKPPELFFFWLLGKILLLCWRNQRHKLRAVSFAIMSKRNYIMSTQKHRQKANKHNSQCRQISVKMH